MCVCLISYMSDSEGRLKLGLPLWANCLVLCFLNYPSFSIIAISLTKRLTKLLTKLLTKQPRTIRFRLFRSIVT